MPPLSLYIHIPWCIQKCPYCDFNSHAVKGDLPESAYIDALLADLQQDIAQFQINRPIHSIFIGGGTPSLFSPASLDRLLQGIKQCTATNEALEITLEANPGTFESNKFAEFKACGINRLSIGVQSFNDQHLNKLGRIHSGQEAIRAAEIAHQSGFENFNLDLMFGLPNEDEVSSETDIKTAIRLNPSHISFYQLTLEPNTYFHKYPPKLPDDDSIFNRQRKAQQRLSAHHYQQYEISAYSQANRQCQHNLNYWQFGDYLGIGAGAHGKISLSMPDKIMRYAKPKQPEQYVKQVGQATQAHAIAQQELPLEFIMNQLRLKQGFTLAHYQAVTGLDPDTLQPALTQCVTQSLLLQQQDHFACSEQGWLFLDSILEKFIG